MKRYKNRPKLSTALMTATNVVFLCAPAAQQRNKTECEVIATSTQRVFAGRKNTWLDTVHKQIDISVQSTSAW